MLTCMQYYDIGTICILKQLTKFSGKINMIKNPFDLHVSMHGIIGMGFTSPPYWLYMFKIPILKPGSKHAARGVVLLVLKWEDRAKNRDRSGCGVPSCIYPIHSFIVGYVGYLKRVETDMYSMFLWMGEFCGHSVLQMLT